LAYRLEAAVKQALGIQAGLCGELPPEAVGLLLEELDIRLELLGALELGLRAFERRARVLLELRALEGGQRLLE
jgi:hypothetical protein